MGEISLHIFSNFVDSKWEIGVFYAEYRFLSFNSDDYLCLLDLDIEISTLEVTGDFDGDIEVTDCLGPFVW